MTTTDPGIAASIDLQRRGYRVTVGEDSVGGAKVVMLWVGKKDAPPHLDAKAEATTLAAALMFVKTLMGLG